MSVKWSFVFSSFIFYLSGEKNQSCRCFLLARIQYPYGEKFGSTEMSEVSFEELLAVFSSGSAETDAFVWNTNLQTVWQDVTLEQFLTRLFCLVTHVPLVCLCVRLVPGPGRPDKVWFFLQRESPCLQLPNCLLWMGITLNICCNLLFTYRL